MFKNKLLERKLLKANTHYTNVDSYENQIGRKEKKKKAYTCFHTLQPFHVLPSPPPLPNYFPVSGLWR